MESDDDFVIIYGINHTQSTFATYFNVSFYDEELWNGVAGAVITNEQQYSVKEYFPKHYKNEKYYYVIKTEACPYQLDLNKLLHFLIYNHKKYLINLN